MNENKTKNNNNRPAGGRGFIRTGIWILIAILAGLIVIMVVETELSAGRAGLEALDAAVEKSYEIAKAGGRIRNELSEGKIPVTVALRRLEAISAAAEKGLREIETLETRARLPGAHNTFEIRKLNAEDVCRAASTYVFSLASAVHFLTFGEVVMEGEAHEELAAALAAELKGLYGNYRDHKTTPGLDSPAPAAADGAEYVFVILIDANRADHLGCYGCERDTSPNIDKLAEEGLLFERAYSQASHTDTSVASLFTALYPYTHKMLDSADWLYEYSLIEKFHEAGYTTGAFSGNEPINRRFHYDHGFDYFEELFYVRAGIIFDRAIRWLERSRKGGAEKMFVYMHLFDPHDIYFAPNPYFDSFDRGTRVTVSAYQLRKLIEYYLPELGKTDPECRFNPYVEEWNNPAKVIGCLNRTEKGRYVTPRGIENMVARYDGEVMYADAQIGRFIEYLKRRGMLEKSTIAILADHGEAFLDAHNQTKHGRAVYDNLIHVPLIFYRGAKKFGGVRVKEQVETVDTLPTLMGMLGIEPPQGLHGRNLLETPPRDGEQVYSMTCQGYDPAADEYLFVTTVREPEYKYIRNFRRSDRSTFRDEFYSLEHDPGELKDARNKFPEDFERLKKDLERWELTTDTKPPRQIRTGPDEYKQKIMRDLGYLK